MAAPAQVLGVPAQAAESLAADDGHRFVPIRFVYRYLHDAIRSELSDLATELGRLSDGGGEHGPALSELLERYSFLRQIYMCHSRVEDEVVYPVLEAKVPNVTSVYSVEHDDEEDLLARLVGELAGAPVDYDADWLRGVKALAWQVHVTTLAHLAKEEEQLLPLLEARFTHAEQVELVAAFQCSVPVSDVRRVMAWIRPSIPPGDLERLRDAMQLAPRDPLTRALLRDWLGAQPAIGCDGGHPHDAVAPGTGLAPEIAAPASGPVAPPASTDGCDPSPDAAPADKARLPTPPLPSRPPLDDVLLFHEALARSIDEFASRCEALPKTGLSAGFAAQAGALLESHRFIRDVAAFHGAGEDAVLYPALALLCDCEAARGRRPVTSPPSPGADEGPVTPAGVDATASGDPSAPEEPAAPAPSAPPSLPVSHSPSCPAAQETAANHAASAAREHTRFARLGRLLQEARALGRRGESRCAELVRELAQAARELAHATRTHMVHEEKDVIPALAKGLSYATQQALLWQALLAMPLRLLRRVVPWLTRGLAPADARAWLDNLVAGAPPPDAPLVALVLTWGAEAAAGAGTRGTDPPLPGPDPAPRPLAPSAPLPTPGEAPVTRAARVRSAATAAATAAPTPKRIRTGRSSPRRDGGAAVPASRSPPRAASPGVAGSRRASEGAPAARVAPPPEAGATPPAGSGWTRHSPIDHIFQFHKALRRELRDVDAEVRSLAALCAKAAGVGETTETISRLCARFQFLSGIYRAHSRSEDEVVFPALEAKEVLHNVSHAYTLDHEREEELFTEAGRALREVADAATLPALRARVAELQTLCAGVRASLETHITAEERELWPLFAEHFPASEQEALVGRIIGQTGAEVLQAMLSWVRGALEPEEEDAMMLAFRSAASATAFDRWLDAAVPARAGAEPPTPRDGGERGEPRDVARAPPPATSPARSAASPGASAGAADDLPPSSPLREVARYLSDAGFLGEPAGPSAGAAGAPARPGASAGAALPAAAPRERDDGIFRPGWESIFAMNQTQLQAAVRRVSGDPSLEPQRKAYLIQNIMASRYIVAQQRAQARSRAAQRARYAEGAGAGTPAHDGAAEGAALPSAPSAAPAAAGGVAASSPSSGAAAPSPRTDALRAAELGADAAMAPLPVAWPRNADAGPGAPPRDDPPDDDGPSAPAPPPAHTWFVSWRDEAKGILGCKHYRTGAALIAPCCGAEHACRLCHNEAEGHEVDRYSITEMRCMSCGQQQPVAAGCRSCGSRLARYCCLVCRLWDDEPGRHIYHCPFCNLCRRGRGLGIDAAHCMSCNACMSLDLYKSHACRADSLAGDCPVCHDPLFESQMPVKGLPCSHFMHSHCFAAYTRHGYTCPLCSRSLGDMTVLWQMLDGLLETEARMPAPFADRVQRVLCNDCGAKSAAPFHFVYHKCSGCGGYNTRVL